MKLSLQNGRLMVTLPQSKAKARALNKYIDLFMHDDAPLVERFTKIANAIRFGGTVRLSALVNSASYLSKVLPTSARIINERVPMIEALRPLLPPEDFNVAVDAFYKAQDAHNDTASMMDWLETQGLKNAASCGLIAQELLEPQPDFEDLFSKIRNLETSFAHFTSLGVASPKNAAKMKPYEQYAITLQLLRDLGHSELADDFLRTEGVAA